jgi:hypothetical protein
MGQRHLFESAFVPMVRSCLHPVLWFILQPAKLLTNWFNSDKMYVQIRKLYLNYKCRKTRILICKNHIEATYKQEED